MNLYIKLSVITNYILGFFLDDNGVGKPNCLHITHILIIHVCSLYCFDVLNIINNKNHIGVVWNRSLYCSYRYRAHLNSTFSFDLSVIIIRVWSP